MPISSKIDTFFPFSVFDLQTIASYDTIERYCRSIGYIQLFFPCFRLSVTESWVYDYRWQYHTEKFHLIFNDELTFAPTNRKLRNHPVTSFHLRPAYSSLDRGDEHLGSQWSGNKNWFPRFLFLCSHKRIDNRRLAMPVYRVFNK